MFRNAARRARYMLCNNNAKMFQMRTAATASQGRKEGTIADAFASLSGQAFEALEPRFASVKTNLIRGHERAVEASWVRLLSRLREEVRVIEQLGSAVVPQIDFCDLDSPSQQFSDEYRKRGCAVIRGVVPQEEALQMKEDLKDYIRNNPSTKAFPADNPQVFELYWSSSQIRARGHPNLLKAQRFALSYWHSKDPDALVSSQPISYADRLRMRQPGDAKFALGPHVDGGSCERWEPEGYGKGNVYEKIWKDLYHGQGACTAFRMAQGWLAMSQASAFEGTLLVNPLLQLATAYYLLRPFFTAHSPLTESATKLGWSKGCHSSAYLSPENWKLELPVSSWLHGANLGRGQELSSVLHPHLDLSSTMVHVPTVQPGDYVLWHCDSIHSVDPVHQGRMDSSVLYIPACPLTVENAKYLVRQRDCFFEGRPSPDFPGGVGESNHVGVARMEDVAEMGTNGMRAMGLGRWDSVDGRTAGEKEVMRQANQILGFD